MMFERPGAMEWTSEEYLPQLIRIAFSPGSVIGVWCTDRLWEKRGAVAYKDAD